MNTAVELSHPIFKIVGSTADRMNLRAYAVGGFVRDSLLGRDCKDIDFVCVGSGIDLAHEVAKAIDPRILVHYFKNFGTAHFNYDGFELEFVGARRESYQRDSRKPIVEDGTLEDDQHRRDFTINALAVGLNKDNYGEILDSFNGVQDLRDGILRTPLDPDITFSDDPLRMMRAIRFATQLNFIIEPSVFEAIARNAERLKIISQERITDELNKIMRAKIPSNGFLLLEQSGLLPLILPELQKLKGVEEYEGKGHKDNFYHTLQVLDNVARKSDNLWLRWAALLHDIAKPPTKRFVKGQGWTFHGHEHLGSKWVPRIFRHLKLPLDEPMKFVQKLVLLHLRPIPLSKDEITDSAIRRLLFDAGDDLESLFTLCEADITSKNKAKVHRFLANFKVVKQKCAEVEEKDSIRNFQPPVTGELIMQTFGIPPSKPIGVIKEAIKEAILDGKIRNDFDEAKAMMLQLGKELGLQPV